jgi:hypothetical protein
MAFHYVLEGRLQVRLGRETPIGAERGHFILLAHNDPHFLGSDVNLPPREAGPLVRKAGEHELARIDFGDENQDGRHFVCGFLASTLREHPLLTALPPLLVADLRGQPCAEWAETFFCYAQRHAKAQFLTDDEATDDPEPSWRGAGLETGDTGFEFAHADLAAAGLNCEDGRAKKCASEQVRRERLGAIPR